MTMTKKVELLEVKLEEKGGELQQEGSKHKQANANAEPTSKKRMQCL